MVMNSGNTFRFRADGSRIEVYARASQPVRSSRSTRGSTSTAVDRSKPITQLIPRATYQSFGTHDGLGFGRTYPARPRLDRLVRLGVVRRRPVPEGLPGCIVRRQRCDEPHQLRPHRVESVTPVAKEPDFMTSKDLWFSPGGHQARPDGALCLRLYNKIIGHYEVDLQTPRPRIDHGRLRRIV